jgi:hypothetical protein
MGLRSFSIRVADEATLKILQERLHVAGLSFEDRSASMNLPSILTADQDGNGVEIMEV